jgi:hypothetical protein
MNDANHGLDRKLLIIMLNRKIALLLLFQFATHRANLLQYACDSVVMRLIPHRRKFSMNSTFPGFSYAWEGCLDSY